MIDLLIGLAGIALILAGIVDVFFTVLHYDGYGFLSSRLYDGLYRAACLLTGPLSRRGRAFGLSLAAPLMVPVTITVWILQVSLGYALVYYAGMDRETFLFSSSRLEPSMSEAFYLSGVVISTLGLGDVTATGGVYQVLLVSEALIGFGILTLAISYVIGVYGVMQRLGVLAAGLYHQAQDTSDPLTILVPHFPEGQHRGLETHLMDIHRGLVEIFEGIRRYPVVYYFHRRRTYRSLPYTFRMIGGMAAALRWGLPQGHPGSQTPWLPTLITGYEDVTGYLEHRFLPKPLEASPDPVPFEVFESTLLHGKEPADPWISRFLRMSGFMADLVRLDAVPDTKEAYERYVSWLPFAHRDLAFFEGTARSLGYGIQDLQEGGVDRLF